MNKSRARKVSYSLSYYSFKSVLISISLWETRRSVEKEIQTSHDDDILTEFGWEDHRPGVNSILRRISPSG